MRSRRSDIRARLAVRSALRSSRLSLGPASDLRRARASEAVMGAGATGPFCRLVASLRLGVGRPLGPVLRRAPESNRSIPALALPSAASSTTTSWLPSSWPFLRPGSFTVVRLLRERTVDENDRICHLLRTRQRSDLRWRVMNGSGASEAAGGGGPGRLLRPEMRVLVAPDCYGGSLSAVEAAAAIATGWTRSRPDDRFIIAPQSDGGPGFVEVLSSRLGRQRRLRV